MTSSTIEVRKSSDRGSDLNLSIANNNSVNNVAKASPVARSLILFESDLRDARDVLSYAAQSIIARRSLSKPSSAWSHRTSIIEALFSKRHLLDFAC